MKRRSPGFEFEDHVADVRVRAWGSGFEETLAVACMAAWQCVSGTEPLPITRSWMVTAAGFDAEEMLVNFLNEQILLFDSEGLVPGSIADVVIQEDHGTISVRATFGGCLTCEMGRAPEKCLKAVTYSGLVVTPELIEVTLDV